jgi:hypothetical protein
MKNQSTLTNVKHRPGRCGSALAALLLLGIAASSSSGQVLPPSSLPYGYSYQEWSAKFWQYDLGQSTNHLEALGDPGICSGPASRVRFLGPSHPGSSGGSAMVTNHITVPEGTPLFLSIQSLWVDNGNCPISAFTTFTADQLAAQDEAQWSLTTETSCTIDGVAVAGLDDPINTIYHVVSPPFSYTTEEHDNVLAGELGATCIPGGFTIYPAVGDGVYLMLAPLSPGKHTIHTVGVVGPVSTPFVKVDITSVLTVNRDHDGDHDHDHEGK